MLGSGEHRPSGQHTFSWPVPLLCPGSLEQVHWTHQQFLLFIQPGPVWGTWPSCSLWSGHRVYGECVCECVRLCELQKMDILFLFIKKAVGCGFVFDCVIINQYTTDTFKMFLFIVIGLSCLTERFRVVWSSHIGTKSDQKSEMAVWPILHWDIRKWNTNKYRRTWTCQT